MISHSSSAKVCGAWLHSRCVPQPPIWNYLEKTKDLYLKTLYIYILYIYIIIYYIYNKYKYIYILYIYSTSSCVTWIQALHYVFTTSHTLVQGIPKNAAAPAIVRWFFQLWFSMQISAISRVPRLITWSYSIVHYYIIMFTVGFIWFLSGLTGLWSWSLWLGQYKPTWRSEETGAPCIGYSNQWDGQPLVDSSEVTYLNSESMLLKWYLPI